jgi:hypothetical protein
MRSKKCKHCNDVCYYDDYGPIKECSCKENRTRKKAKKVNNQTSINNKYKNVNIQVELRDVYQAIEDEPDIEGEIPYELYQEICKSKEIATLVYNKIIHETKWNIVCRVGKLLKDKQNEN